MPLSHSEIIRTVFPQNCPHRRLPGAVGWTGEVGVWICLSVTLLALTICCRIDYAENRFLLLYRLTALNSLVRQDLNKLGPRLLGQDSSIHLVSWSPTPLSEGTPSLNAVTSLPTQER
jgi:hypothetical protein